MGEDKSEKLNENEVRPALGDITNQVGRRGLSLVSSSTTSSKSGIGNKRPAESASDSDSHFWKQVALVVEKLGKERGRSAKCPKVSDETRLSPLKGGKTYCLQSPPVGGTSLHGSTHKGVRNVNAVVKEPTVSALDSIDLGEAEGEVVPKVVTLSETTKENCIGSVNVMVGETSSKDGEMNCLETGKDSQGETRGISDVAENNCTQEALAPKVGSSRFGESQDTGSFGLERCTRLKGDSCSDLSAGIDLLKSCSCSFCTKAAYIWSDLHYQDVKGRISILMKSQKEASNLAQRYSGENERDIHGQGNSSKTTNMETDLTSQWKSLFLNMENIFCSENNQLQANFLALKDLREEFKTNLEMINGVPLDEQPSSSDPSDHTVI